MYTASMPTSFKHPVAMNKETRELVTPLGTAFANARLYNPDEDYKKLICNHCFKAAMTHHREGGELVPETGRHMIAGGNLRGNRAHFQTSPRSAHADDCVASVIVQDPDYDPDKINHNKGFKIYLNSGILKRQFNDYASLVRRDDDRRIIVMDPDLLDRETISAKTPKDFVKLIKSGHFDRLTDSKIVFHNEAMYWSDFFIRKGERSDNHPYSRWIHLAQRLLTGHASINLFHLDLKDKQPKEIINHKGTRMRYRLPPIKFPHPEMNAVVSLIPLVQIKNEKLFERFRNAHEFLVLATPRIYQGGNDWFMDIDVKDPKKLLEADLKEINTEAKLRAELRKPQGQAELAFG